MTILNLSETELKKALDFYEIKDIKYINNCYICLNHILNNPILKSHFEEVFNILYNNLTSNIRPTWKLKSKEDIFSNNYHNYTTNLMLLFGFKVHIANTKKYSSNSNEIKKQKERIKQALTNDIYNRKLNDIRISQMLWGIYIINMKIIEVGRLQYEHYKDKENEYIKIHIPEGEKLTYNNVVQSINESKKYINKYFGISEFNYYCTSWLLSPQIKEMLNESSNIYKFQTLFIIEEGASCLKDILNFVYKKEIDYDIKLLEENTTLQKHIKDYLLRNKTINIGIGKLKTLPIFD